MNKEEFEEQVSREFDNIMSPSEIRNLQRFVSDLEDIIVQYNHLTAYEPQETITRSDAIELSKKHDMVLVIGLGGEKTGEADDDE